MKRRLVTLAAAASLLLCAATLVLWVRSYHWVDRLCYVRDSDRTGQSWRIQSLSARLEFALFQGSAIRERARCEYVSYSVEPPAWDMSLYFGPTRIFPLSSAFFLGFGFVSHEVLDQSLRAICFPHWFVALIFAIPPALRLRAAIRSRGSPGHECPACGYDLRATPERCPECGTAPAAPAAR